MDPIVAAFFKKSVVAAPGGQPAPPPAPPMDPAMMQGGMPPMDPAMMQGGMPPMDPAMMQGGMPMPPAPPMDPAMMQGGMPPAPMNIEQEIMQIKDMLQQLMDAQIAMMQALAPGGMPMPPGPTMDPAMMQGGMPPGPPAPPPPGMTVTASDNSDEQDLNSFIKSISSLLR